MTKVTSKTGHRVTKTHAIDSRKLETYKESKLT